MKCERRSFNNIDKGRFEELQKEIVIGIEASKRGEVVDADTAFSQLQPKLNKRKYE
jgi:antitoxin ParD1/3/4